MALEGTPQVSSGVYQATLVGPKPEMVKIEKWPYPKLHVEFQLKDGQKAVWSEDIGVDVFYLIRSLTGKSLPTGLFSQDNNTVFAAALQALQGHTWSGLVRVGLYGYIDQVAFYPGSYLWRFLRLATRTKEGLACDVDSIDKKTGEAFKWIKWDAEVVTGPCKGLRHTQYMKLTSYSILTNGNLRTSPKGKLWKFIEGIIGERAFQHEPGCENIWPLIEQIAQQAARDGLLYTANVCSIQPLKADGKKNWDVGNIDWDTIITAHPSTVPNDVLPLTDWGEIAATQVPQTDQATIDALTASLCERLNAIAGKLGLEGMFIGTGKDTESQAGQTLFAHLVGPIINTFPLTGMKKFWPTFSDDPAKSWGVEGTQACIEVLHHFENMPDENLAMLVGEGKAGALVEELTTVFPHLLEPEPEPVVEEMESDAIPF